MRVLALIILAIAAAVASPASQAVPPGGGGGGGGHVAPGHGYGGAGGAGGPYRPGYGPGYGHGGWRYGYPGYGYGYRYGWGLGLGYGAGWALAAASPWYWGAPAAAYWAPAYYPYGYQAWPYPALTVNEDLTYVQQPQVEAAAPPPVRRATGYWYYCTEPAGYHPYVAQCSRPWIAVQPQPAPPADGTQPNATAP